MFEPSSKKKKKKKKKKSKHKVASNFNQEYRSVEFNQLPRIPVQSPNKSLPLHRRYNSFPKPSKATTFRISLPLLPPPRQLLTASSLPPFLSSTSLRIMRSRRVSSARISRENELKARKRTNFDHRIQFSRRIFFLLL